jgi:hypothetical protein
MKVLKVAHRSTGQQQIDVVHFSRFSRFNRDG